MERELITAIRAKNLIKVKELLAAGANPNAKEGGQTAYQIANKSRNAREIQCELIEAGAEDSSIVHSLVWVIDTGRVETVRALIARGADVDVDTYCGTPIQNAAKKGDREIVDLLIEANADVNACGGISTALLDALEQGHNEIAIKLIAAGANPNTSETFTAIPPIVMAATHSSAEVIEALVNAGANINIAISQITLNRNAIRQQVGSALTSAFKLLETTGQAIDKLDEDNPNVSETVESFPIAAEKAKLASSNIPQSQTAFDSTPVILAARCGNIGALKALLEAGANPNLKDGEGLSAYEWAIKNELPQVLAVLKQAGIDRAIVTPEEQILNAVELGNIALVQKLIEQGTDLNCRDRRRKKKNYTPLMLATVGGHWEIVETLLAANANANLSNDSGKPIPEFLQTSDLETISSGYQVGQTALMLAANKGFINIVRKLIAARSEIDFRDKLGNTALFYACHAGHLEIAELFLNSGANINLKNINGESILLAPATKCDLPIIELLVNRNIDVNALSEGLAAAAGVTREIRTIPERRVLEAVKLLVSKGADVNTQALNTTVIGAAASRGYLKVIQYLLDRGANPEIKDQDGYDALYLADLFDRRKALELLKQHTGKLNWKRNRYHKEEVEADEVDKWGEEVQQPDFTEAANNPEYQQAVRDLGKICGSKPVTLHDIPGWFQIHVNTQKSPEIDTEKIQKQFLQRGSFVYEPKNYFTKGMRKLCILPTTDKYNAIALHQTNGSNYDVGTGYIIKWLKNLEQKQTFVLTCIANDTLSGRFLDPVKNPEQLAKEIYDLCSDIVEQGCGSIEKLAEILRENQGLYFWWD